MFKLPVYCKCLNGSYVVTNTHCILEANFPNKPHFLNL